jgi:hypothetical protein
MHKGKQKNAKENRDIKPWIHAEIHTHTRETVDAQHACSTTIAVTNMLFGIFMVPAGRGVADGQQ